MKNIKIIPTSLCIIGFLSTFGPWGAFDVSERSQISRLEHLLTMNEVLVNNKIQTTKRSVSFEDKKEISSIVTYLNSMHGFSGIQAWFNQRLDTLGTDTSSVSSGSRHRRPQFVVGLMGLEYVTGSVNSKGEYYAFATLPVRELRLEGYTNLIRLENFGMNDTQTVSLDDMTRSVVRSDLKNMSLIILCSGSISDSLRIDLQPLTGKLMEAYGMSGYQANIPIDKMTLIQSNASLTVKMIVHRIEKRAHDESRFGTVIDADILFRIDRKQ